jgi:hypothetical protein
VTTTIVSENYCLSGYEAHSCVTEMEGEWDRIVVAC